MFEFQINGLRRYINWPDERIARCRKQSQDPERLLDNKTRALATMAELEGYVQT